MWVLECNHVSYEISLFILEVNPFLRHLEKVRPLYVVKSKLNVKILLVNGKLQQHNNNNNKHYRENISEKMGIKRDKPSFFQGCISPEASANS